MNNLNIEKFNLSRMYLQSNDKVSILIIGMQNSGKTFLCKDILHTFRDRLISGDILTHFTNFELTTNEFIKEKSFLIIDDVFFEEGKIHKDLKKICIKNPFDLFIFTCNYIIEEEIIKEIDYIFLSPSKIESILRRLYDYFNNKFKDYLEFCKICKIIYECHNFLVIDNKNKSENIEDYIFWYKAEEIEFIRIGINDYSKILI